MKMMYGTGGGYSRIAYSCSPGLESIVGDYSGKTEDISYMVEAAEMPSMLYEGNDISDRFDAYEQDNYSIPWKKEVSVTYRPAVDNFLADVRTNIFVGDAAEIKDIIYEAFEKTTGLKFPRDVLVNVVSEKKLKKVHSGLCGKWTEAGKCGGIQGFAINRKEKGMMSEVFVKKGELAKTMLTLGHELGHVLTGKLRTALDEEAKAFAFSMAWMKAIKQENIGNLSTTIRLDMPAANGLHNKALEFVLKEAEKGKEAFDIYLELVRRMLEVDKNG